MSIYNNHDDDNNNGEYHAKNKKHYDHIERISFELLLLFIIIIIIIDIHSELSGIVFLLLSLKFFAFHFI